MNLLRMAKALFTSAPRFTPLECAARVRSAEAILVDVREPGEWPDGVAEHAVLLPLSDLTGARVQWTAFLAGVSGREILVYCLSGGRSGIAARLLVSEGHRAANTGGLSEWTSAGWLLVKPDKSGKRRH